jgi:hypothetical protein
MVVLCKECERKVDAEVIGGYEFHVAVAASSRSPPVKRLMIIMPSGPPKANHRIKNVM